MQNFRNYRPLARAWGDPTRNRCRFGAFRPPNHRFRQTFCTRPPQKRKPQERRTTNGMKIDSRARANEKATGRRSKEVEGGRRRSRGRSEPGRAEQPDRRSQRHRRNRSQRESAGAGKQRHHGSNPSQREGPWCRKATAPQVEPKSARSREVRPGDVKARRDWTSVHRGGLERLRDVHRGFAASSSSGGRQAVGTPESIAAGLSGSEMRIAASQRRLVAPPEL